MKAVYVGKHVAWVDGIFCMGALLLSILGLIATSLCCACFFCFPCADLGIVDPLELVAMHKSKQQSDAAESDGASNGSSNGNGTPADSSSSGGSGERSAMRSASSSTGSTASKSGSAHVPGYKPGDVDSLGRYDPHTDRFVGGTAGVSTNGYVTTGEEQLMVDRNAVHADVAEDGNGNGDGAMTKKGTEWGLLQLDLSFAWKMEDKPVEDVGKMLQDATAQAPAVAR